MPRENRKRGKKHKIRRAEQTTYDANTSAREDILLQDEPESSQLGLLYGQLDPDVKAYFRTVDNQLRDWQVGGVGADVEAGIDSNEERRMFFTAALSEMKGKELQLATDPECSPILERMLYSMDDFVRRVFTDCLAGSWLSLITDRFASHVCQTLLTVVADTVTRESHGILPSIPSSLEMGELLTMTDLVLNACEDILPELANLFHDQYASHVLRALLLLLAPTQLASDSHSRRYAPSARSKKSASWKARIGPMEPIILNVFDLPHSIPEERAELTPPESFSKMANRILCRLRDVMDGNEVRAMAADKVASPLLQMTLILEASLKQADMPDSIMDRVLAGLVSEKECAPSPYVSGLFVNSTSSHLSESILVHCSSDVFIRLWDLYFANNLPHLAMHPVANFVVARGVERLDVERLEITISRLHGTWSKARKSSYFGVLNSLVDRAGQLNAQEAPLIETICSIFELTSSEGRKKFLPCVLRLQTLAEYEDALASGKETNQGADSVARHVRQGSRRNTNGIQYRDPLEPATQGSLLLQSILRLQQPYNNIVMESLHSLLPDELLALSCNSTSSRVLDVALESPTVPIQSRKRLVTSFIGRFHLLVDDRIGSRVADRCLAAADLYLKEKIARSLIPHEQFLAGSHFGRYFSRNLRLPLLRLNTDQWKAMQGKGHQITTAANAIQPAQPNRLHSVPNFETTTPTVSKLSESSRKRKHKDILEEDEIDTLFSAIGAKGRKRAAVSTEINVTNVNALDTNILQAIKSAPADTRRGKK